jgi:hypothetical protein
MSIIKPAGGLITWAMLGKSWLGLRYIKAEPPCNKGEIRIGWLTIGWQRSGGGTGEFNEH